MSLELINNPIQFARELSRNLSERADLPTEEDIEETLHVMNDYLYSVNGNISALLHADEAFIGLPDEPVSIELLSFRSLLQSRVEQATLRGKIHSFRWLGSTGMNAFGLQMYGVDVLAPTKERSNNAFIPVEAAGVPVAA